MKKLSEEFGKAYARQTRKKAKAFAQPLYELFFLPFGQAFGLMDQTGSAYQGSGAQSGF
jgi:hypothetical protein